MGQWSIQLNQSFIKTANTILLKTDICFVDAASRMWGIDEVTGCFDDVKLRQDPHLLLLCRYEDLPVVLYHE
jgi:hypothetical protein